MIYKCTSQVEFCLKVANIHRWWSQGNGVFKKPLVWSGARILTSRFGGWKASGLSARLNRHREISFQSYIFCTIQFQENHKCHLAIGDIFPKLLSSYLCLLDQTFLLRTRWRVEKETAIYFRWVSLFRMVCYQLLTACQKEHFADLDISYLTTDHVDLTKRQLSSWNIQGVFLTGTRLKS